MFFSLKPFILDSAFLAPGLHYIGFGVADDFER